MLDPVVSTAQDCMLSSPIWAATLATLLSELSTAAQLSMPLNSHMQRWIPIPASYASGSPALPALVGQHQVCFTLIHLHSSASKHILLWLLLL